MDVVESLVTTSEECILLVGVRGHQCLVMTQKSSPRNRWLLGGNFGSF